MKQILTIIFSALFAIAAYADDGRVVWSNPVSDWMPSHAYFRITSVEFTDTATTICVEQKQFYNENLKFEKPIFIRTADGKKYHMHSLEGAPLDKDLFMNAAVRRQLQFAPLPEKMQLRFHFDPLPEDTQWFDVITDPSCNRRCSNFFFVHDASTTIEHETASGEWTKVRYDQKDDYYGLQKKIEKAGKPLKAATIDVTVLNYRPLMMRDDCIETILYSDPHATQRTAIDPQTHHARLTYHIAEPTLVSFSIDNDDPRISCILVPGETSRLLLDFNSTAATDSTQKNPQSVRADFLGPFAATSKYLTSVSNVPIPVQSTFAYRTHQTIFDYGKELASTVALLPTVVPQKFAKMSQEEFERLSKKGVNLDKLSEGKRNSYLWMYAQDICYNIHPESYEEWYSDGIRPVIETSQLDWSFVNSFGEDNIGKKIYRVSMPNDEWMRKGHKHSYKDNNVRINYMPDGSSSYIYKRNDAYYLGFWVENGQPIYVVKGDYEDSYYFAGLSYQESRGNGFIRTWSLQDDAFTFTGEDGNTLYYRPLSDSTATVWYYFEDKYAGDIIIPETVSHDGKTYTVTTVEHMIRCQQLTSVHLPPTVKSIGFGAFAACTNLRSINLENVEFLERAAFEGCRSLRNVTLNPRMKVLGGNAFDKSGITELTIPDSAEIWNSYGFRGCDSLRTVHLPNTMNEINWYMFDYCKIKEIDIPSQVEEIKQGAFKECRNLETVRFAADSHLKTIADNAFYNCSSLKEIEIPEGVDSIGEYAFTGCDSLKVISLPSTIRSIGRNAAGSRKTIIVHALTPPTCPPSYAVKNTIFVPAGAIEDYKKHPVWGKAEEIKAIEELPEKTKEL